MRMSKGFTIIEAARRRAVEQWKDPVYRKKMDEVTRIRLENPENRRKMREASVRNWENPEFRKMMIEKAKSQWKDPEFREMQSQKIRNISKKLWQNPEYREKQIEKAKKMWEDPEFRESQRQAVSESTIKMWEDPEHRKRISKASREMWEDPEHRKRIIETWSPEKRREAGERQSKRWEDPEYRERMVKVGIRNAENLRKKRYSFDGNWFDSQEEAACGVLMAKYIPKFRVREGETFQLNTEIPKTIDFLVEGIFVEYHPIILCKSENGLGDIGSREEYARFREIREFLSSEEKKEFERDYMRVLAVNYFESRRAAIDQSDTYRGSELVLVQDSGELYDSIITRFGRGYSSRDDFIREFKETIKKVKEAQKK